jgi:hypothetical protein
MIFVYFYSRTSIPSMADGNKRTRIGGQFAKPKTEPRLCLGQPWKDEYLNSLQHGTTSVGLEPPISPNAVLTCTYLFIIRIVRNDLIAKMDRLDVSLSLSNKFTTAASLNVPGGDRHWTRR